MAIFPTTNISMRYVCNAFGYHRSRLSTLCTNAAINMWSKYKPVRNNFTYNRPTDWWRATGGNCGIKLPIYSNISALVSDVRSGNVLIQYLSPRGGATEPFRLGDFQKYDPEAMPPLKSGNLADVYYLNSSIGVYCIAAMQPSDTWLTLSDVYGSSINGMYYGAAIAKVGTQSIAYMTESTPLTTTGGGGIDIPLSGYTTGFYEIYQFLCENPKTSLMAPDIVNRFIPIQDNYMQVIEVKSSTVRITMFLIWARETVTGSATITNEGSGTLFVTSQVVTIRYADKLDKDPLERGETVTILPGTFNVDGGTSKQVPISVSGVLPLYPSRGGRSIYNVNNGQYQGSNLIGSET